MIVGPIFVILVPLFNIMDISVINVKISFVKNVLGKKQMMIIV